MLLVLQPSVLCCCSLASSTLMQCNNNISRHKHSGTSSLGFTKKSKGKNHGSWGTSPKPSASQKLPTDHSSSMLDDDDVRSIQSLKKSLQNCAFCLAIATAIALPFLPDPSSLSATESWVAAIANDNNIGVDDNNAGLASKRDAEGLLRSALPIHNKPIREIQTVLEGILYGGDSAATSDPHDDETIVPSIEKTIRHAAEVLEQSREEILADISEGKREKAQQLLNRLADGLQGFKAIVDDKETTNVVHQKHKELLHLVSNIEETMVKEFPFEVPDEFASKPLLKGRATIEIKVMLKDKVVPSIKTALLKAVLDGYNAPVTAGNFLDLVERHFYDGMEIQKADGLVVQTGDPDGPSEGFVDPSTGRLRTIPLEIMVNGDKHPIYNTTLEELGRETEQTKLPMKSCCPLLMARTEAAKNSASSQVIFLLNEAGAKKEAARKPNAIEEGNSKASEIRDDEDHAKPKTYESSETVTPRDMADLDNGNNRSVDGHMPNGTISMDIILGKSKLNANLPTDGSDGDAGGDLKEVNSLEDNSKEAKERNLSADASGANEKNSKEIFELNKGIEVIKESKATGSETTMKETGAKESAIANETESSTMRSNLKLKDGCNSVFGYVTENEDVLADLKVGDVIESIRVTSGLENLANPSYR